jgi:hypothetical protein
MEVLLKTLLRPTIKTLMGAHKLLPRVIAPEILMAPHKPLLWDSMGDNNRDNELQLLNNMDNNRDNELQLLNNMDNNRDNELQLLNRDNMGDRDNRPHGGRPSLKNSAPPVCFTIFLLPTWPPRLLKEHLTIMPELASNSSNN